MVMRRMWAIVLIVAACVSVPGGARPAGAAFDPGEFTVDVQKSVGGYEAAPTISCSVQGVSMTLEVFLRTVSRWDGSGASPAAQCTATQVSTLTNSSDTGTVSHPTVGSGTFQQTCDMRRTIESAVSLTVAEVTPRTVAVAVGQHSVSGFIACAWAMKFGDSRSTRLSGTIEETLSGSGNGMGSCDGPAQPDSRVVTYCVDLVSENKVWVVGATGAFDDMSGTGLFTDRYHTPITISTSRDSGDLLLRSASARVPVEIRLDGMPAEGSADTAPGMRMALVKNAKATVRLVSPPKTGTTRTLGTGAGGTGLTRVKLSAAPGAKCGITAKSGKRSQTVLAPKTDSDGVISTAVTSATLKSKLSVLAGAKVTLSVYCAVGKSTAKSDQSVTLGT